MSPRVDCPAGFTYVHDVQGCYRVVLDPLRWTSAGMMCRALHPRAHLLIVNDTDEQRAVANLIRSLRSKLQHV